MHAEIIAIGDEITGGQLLDTNSQWLSLRLEELGVRTLYHSTVGDALEPCVALFRAAIDRADIVIVTGGLGPTADDLTRESLAQATGRPLVLDREALEYIRSLFARRKRPMPKQNELQAMFPEGSRVVFNRHGTAPGIDLEVSREGRSSSRVICLPGVPAEMVEMWNGSVRKSLEEFLGSERRVVCRRLIHCFGAGESQVESMLPDMIRRGRQPTVGITASKATITLRIAAEGATEEACLAAMEPTVRTIYECLGSLVFGEGDEQLQHAIVKLLRQHGKTLATAEYGTSGLLGCWLSSVENGCDAYGGGLVLTTEATSVEAAAQQCREQFGADFGLAVALPCPALPTADVESGGRKLGAIVLATADGVQRQEISTAWHPALVGIVAAKTALNLLRLRLIQ